MNASYVSTGSGGPDYEVDVAAAILVRVLTGTSDRLLGDSLVPQNVTLQDRSGPMGFDDVGATCQTGVGDGVHVYVQAKRSFAFTIGDGFPALVRSIHQHDTDNSSKWSAVLAIGVRSAKTADIEILCRSARTSASWKDFAKKWDETGALNEPKRQFLSSLAAVLAGEDQGASWRVLRRLRVVECDFHLVSSRDREAAIRELQGNLQSDAPADASDLFDLLRAEVLRDGSTAASYDRSSLLEKVGTKWRLNPRSAFRASIAAVDDASAHALRSIRAHLAGRAEAPAVCLLRPELDLKLRQMLGGGSVINIIGEAGAGKSAILKRTASAFNGPTFLIKDDRVTACCWAEFASLHGISGRAEAFLDEFAARGPCLLALDGVDRMLLSRRRGLITDLLGSLANSTLRARWTIIATSRVHLQGDSAAAALAGAGFSNIQHLSVANIPTKDVSLLSKVFPSISAFLRQQDVADRNRILFLLNVALAAPTGMQFSTEVGLATSWATWGQHQITPAPTRDVALTQIGELVLLRPELEPGVGDIDAGGRVHLLDEGIIFNHPAKDSLAFVHDVYEDWVLLRAFQRHLAELPRLVEKAGQPAIWQRALRLLGQSLLESGEVDGWKSAIAAFDAADLDPVWARALIASAFHSEQAAAVLDRLEPLLLEDGAALLRRLIETLLVYETYCDEEIFRPEYLEGKSDVERLRAVGAFRIPFYRPWASFLGWSLARWQTWPTALRPKLVELAETWIQSRRGVPSPLAERAVEICVGWLERVDGARDDRAWADPFEERLPRAEMEATTVRLRCCVSLGAAVGPKTVGAYIQNLASKAGYCEGRTELMRLPGRLPQCLPKEFTNLAIAHFVPPRPRSERTGLFRGPLFRFSSLDDEGISHCHDQSPASPLRYGFSDLFKSDEREALRLLHRLEIRASVHYRHSSRCRDRRNPIPVRLDGPRGIVQLWGDENVYRWSRGWLGPDVLGSAYLALDDWMHAQAIKGRPLGELLDLVLQPNGLVSSALPCISTLVRFARTREQVDLALSFLGQPRIWEYEKARQTDDSLGIAFPNFWRQDPAHSVAVQAIRNRYISRNSLEGDLVLRFHVAASPEAQEALKARRDGWSAEDLAAYENESDDAAIIAGYQHIIDRQRFFADPGNVQAEPHTDPTKTIYSFREPPEFRALRERVVSASVSLDRAMFLSMWVTRSREMGRLEDRLSLEGAVDMATELEEMAPPEGDTGWLFERNRAVGIVGTTALLTRFADTAKLRELLPWAEPRLLSVCRIARDYADNLPETHGYQAPNEAFVVAAEGLGSLIGRGMGGPDHRRLALELATQPPADIACALVRHLVPDEMDFRWRLLVAALGTCVMQVQHSWEKGDPSHAARRRFADRQQAIRVALGRGSRVRGPRVPPHPYADVLSWSKSWRKPIIRRRKLNNVVFDYQRAAKLLKVAPVAAIVACDRLGAFQTYLRELASWSVRYTDDDASGRHLPYELVHQLATTMGKLAAAGGSTALWLSLTSFRKDQTSESLVGRYLEAVVNELVRSGRPPDERFWAAWNPASDWALANVEIDEADFDEHRNLGAAFEAAGFIGPYESSIPMNWPHLDAILPAMDKWFQKAAFSRIAVTAAISFAIRFNTSQRNLWLLRWLDLLIQKHGRNERFWETLGDTAAALIAPLANELSSKEDLRRILGRLADAGSLVARQELAKVETRDRPVRASRRPAVS